jgi:hypothetical protein
MENLIEKDECIIYFKDKIHRLDVARNMVSDADIDKVFLLKFRSLSIENCEHVFFINEDEKELRVFIKACVQEYYNKKLNELKEELNQYVISKKI